MIEDNRVFSGRTLGTQDRQWPGEAGEFLCLDSEPNYTSGQAARLLGIPPRTMRHYLSTGKIGGVQNPITGTWLISRSALFEFASARGQVLQSLRPQRTVLVIERPSPVGIELTHGVESTWPGSRVLRLDNNFDGLVQAAGTLPDLLVFDAELPELPGHELLRILRRNSQTAGIRIVAVTGRPELRPRLMAVGADEVLFRHQYGERLPGVLARLFPENKKTGQRWPDDDGIPRL